MRRRRGCGTVFRIPLHHLRRYHAVRRLLGAAHMIVHPARAAAPQSHHLPAPAPQFHLRQNVLAFIELKGGKRHLARRPRLLVHHKILNARGILHGVQVRSHQALLSRIAHAVPIAVALGIFRPAKFGLQLARRCVHRKHSHCRRRHQQHISLPALPVHPLGDQREIHIVIRQPALRHGIVRAIRLHLPQVDGAKLLLVRRPE